MNENKIAFIICVNNELYFEECNWYLNQLSIPEGFERDIIAVREANSAAEAYNAAMSSTDAKYKVYMHQDVFISNRNFIKDCVETFKKDKQLGMLGVIGGVNLPKSGIMYSAWNCGRTIASDWRTAVDIHLFDKQPYQEVEALDGMLLVTQYDISWREDILKQWHFYDVSQSFEFRKAGYRIAVPYQEIPWAVHDCGHSELRDYDENRKIMFFAYPEMLPDKWEDHPFTANLELNELTDFIYHKITEFIDRGEYQEAEQLLNSFEESGTHKNIVLIRNIFEIMNLEKSLNSNSYLLDNKLATVDLIERYTVIKFILRRIELDADITMDEVAQCLRDNQISLAEVIVGTMHSIVNKQKVLEFIKQIYLVEENSQNVSILNDSIKKLDLNNHKRKEADYWSNYKLTPERTRWWQSKAIIQHYNKNICGKDLDGWNAGPIDLLRREALIPEGGFENAISIGCGYGQKEINLIKSGVVKHFTCVDISDGMIEKARLKAKENQVEDQMEFLCADIYHVMDRKETYDLVFWDNSLHHMESAEDAVRISKDLLKKEGIFFCNDFIGNTRFQWSDMQMAIVNGIRLYLSEEYFTCNGGGKFNRFLSTPSIEQMLEIDPSEAADSDNIIPSIKKYFKDPTIKNTGGLIYHLCLEDILQNMPEDSEILKHMLELDDQTIQFGLSLYAFIYAVK